jgi:thiamine kinase-like enzyme
MLVLNLCKQFCPEKIPAEPGERLGDGADGETFVIADEPTKVMKLSVIYDRFEDSPKEIYFNRIAPVLDYVMLNAPALCVAVYEHGYLGEYSRKVTNWRQGKQIFVIHYCIMERLHNLSDDERKALHSLVSHEDRKIQKDLEPSKIKEIVEGLARGLDFDKEKVILFCEQLREAYLSHSDIHPRNIMKDGSGYFKLVDFDRAILEN